MPIQNGFIALIFGLFCLPVSISAGQNPNPAPRQELMIGVGNFAPFFIEKNNSGLFVEIIKSVFARLPQYRIKLKYMSNHRILEELKMGRLDGAANILTPQQLNHGYLSHPVFLYSDVAISLKQNKLSVNSLEDLSKYSIATFQGADKFFGEPFNSITKEHFSYQEYPQVDTTIQLLINNRVELIIIDIHMVPYYLDTYFHGKFSQDILKYHYLFPIPTAYTYMGFLDRRIRNDFNLGLAKIKKNGEYQAIYKKYQQEKPWRSRKKPD
ncbi:transporter substrate-binding domain-containing protein [Thalassomonas viridans]|uniref:Transporter substrate-binding domain-containing protein n=1 Tax=Thalassomonas viridans TaxID=137584 RepID=A0AAE9Z564_9GAMM|nr:transporter substrate-binding domain-containing protein [Thalassomonas viridans]WDE05453.1 transporter substrate-binding domain-containing protein [Thalassomonas viridans]